jgi:hypothetical protein
MASFSNSTELAILKLLLNATNWANIADNTVTSPATNLYVSLHNANPGDAGSQTTNETVYTNYARVAVARTTGGFTTSGADASQVVNAATISFAQCGATGDTLTYWGLGLGSSGAGTLLMSGPIGPGPAYAFTCTNASPGSLTIPGAGTLAVNTRVAVFPVGPFATLPTGFTEGTVYYVGTSGAGVATLSTTAGNANPVNTSSTGAGVIIICSPLAVATNITPSFAAGALIAYLD